MLFLRSKGSLGGSVLRLIRPAGRAAPCRKASIPRGQRGQVSPPGRLTFLVKLGIITGELTGE